MTYPTYNTYVFDCDGVVLDSNAIKTEAFRLATNRFGGAAADAMVEYHVSNGGISRFAKFQYFVDEILPDLGVTGDASVVRQLLQSYSEAVADGLLNCKVADGLEEFRNATKGANWLIVSGGAQTELREIFSRRGIADFFDGGIFGSPDTKDQIFHREIQNGNVAGKALFLGDSRYDIEAAKRAGLDMVFLSGWTEVENWRDLVKREAVPHAGNIAEVLKNLRSDKDGAS